MVRQLYSALHYLALPFIFLRLAWRGHRDPGYWERWGERFGRVPALPGEQRTVWIHAVSVGEAGTRPKRLDSGDLGRDDRAW